MKRKTVICLMTSFESLDATFATLDNIYEYLSKKFKKLYIINSDNLRYFPIEKKIVFPKNIKNRSKRIILLNIKDNNEFNKFIFNKRVILINNFGKSFFDLKIHFLLKKKNIHQIRIGNVGNIQTSRKIFFKKFYFSLKYLFLNRFFIYITNFLSLLRLINKIDINFTSNKNIIDSFKKNRLKNFLFEKNFFFSKKFILVNSKLYDELKINKNKLKKDYIVHLDYFLNYYHEKEIRGKINEKTLKIHHNNICKFLKCAQNKLKKKVIICIHPNYPVNYFQKYYKDFKIVKFKTKEMIQRADLVTFFNSSAIISAILLNKKIVQLNTKLIDKNFEITNERYQKILGLNLTYLENFQCRNFSNLYKNSTINKNKIKSFVETLHCHDKKKSAEQKIFDTLKQVYSI